MTDDYCRGSVDVKTQPMECFMEGNNLRVERAAPGASRDVTLVNDGVMAENKRPTRQLSVPSAAKL